MCQPLHYTLYFRELRALLKKQSHDHLIPIAHSWDVVRSASGRSHAPLLLAITLYGEARGEPLPGMIAIVEVLANRCHRQNQPNIDKVLLEPHQFHSLNYGNSALHAAQDLSEERVITWLTIAQDSLDTLRDPEHPPNAPHATVFATEAAVLNQFQRYLRNDSPHWDFAKLRRVAFIGRHVFFKEV